MKRIIEDPAQTCIYHKRMKDVKNRWIPSSLYTPQEFPYDSRSEHLRWNQFTLGLLTLRGGGPSEQRLWQPELSGGYQPLLVYLGRQRLVTCGASGISQP